jgi:vacuolar-type H+-ATPase subunit H
MDSGLQTILTSAVIWLPIVSLILNFVLALFLIFLVQNGKLKPKEQQQIEAEMINVIKKADLTAVKIIEEATGKSQKIINEAEGTKKLLISKLDKLVDDTVDIAQNQLDVQKGAIIDKFREIYTELMDQYKSESQVLFSNLQHEARSQQEKFRNDLQSSMADIFKNLQEKNLSDLEQANKDITEYREKTFLKIDEQAKSLIKDYIAGYFTQEASKKDHENIVFKALESFKNRKL